MDFRRARPRQGLDTCSKSRARWHPYKPTEVAFHEYKAIAGDMRAARTWRERWGYMLRGPGWAPQDS